VLKQRVREKVMTVEETVIEKIKVLPPDVLDLLRDACHDRQRL
jgi:hypothetical protein